MHAILKDVRAEHRLWLPKRLSNDIPLAAIVMLDDDTPARTDAVLRFWRHLRREAGGESPTLPPQQRQRLILSLRALDAHLAGASYRAIATKLFGARRVATESWKTASIRDRTIRLVRGGIRLMQRRYHALLRGRSRR